ncbi:AurF N-oxygenase family protein [Mycobacterium aquaticum]|uniref:Diiron oxygenase n=1 Tax=Mycobacterium aquaticum TaxID=1927124 RepID=A0A1X0AP01_9MYCO|nr:diiron oxygenase [Mycobacterium aquaticum]ORA31752.1 hypothetical protein BST13_24495 [Mycobacterium aquaticum]
MSSAAVLPTHEDLSDIPRERYHRLLARLSHLSVTHHFDAYGDIDWDATELAIDPTDPRWELPADDPLASTTWYQALPQETRARIGLDRVATMMKTGLDFERVLKRGLLDFADTLPSGSPEFRYAYHEVIEEAQHSLMFQEFVNRTGFQARGLGRLTSLGGRFISTLGRRFPPLFFVFVLGGEEPIDYVQRKVLRSERELHPLLERVMYIHVVEEARHLSFAQSYLRTRVPSLGRFAKARLAIGAPVILAVMARMMLRPSRQLAREHGIPARVLRDAYRGNREQRAETIASIRRVRRLCEDLGLLTGGYARLWRALGLDDAA